MKVSESNFTEWTPRQVVIATLVAAGIVALFALVYWLRLVILSLFTAILLSTAIRPLSDRLQSLGLNRPLSVGLVLLVIFLAVALIIVGLIPIFGDAGVTVIETIREYYFDFRQMLIESPSALVSRLAAALPGEFSEPIAPQNGGEMTIEPALGIVGQVWQVILVSAAIVMMTFFWLLERERALLSVLLLFPIGRRAAVESLFNEIETGVGQYLRGMLVLCLSIAVLALIAYLIIGLPNPIFLALLAGIFELVPMVGPVLGAIPAAVIALVDEPAKVIWVIVATVIIQNAENYLLVPRIMRQAAGVNSFVTLLALAAFGSVFGLVGALLAIPLAVVIQLVLNKVLLDPEAAISSPTNTGRDYTSKLRYEAQELVQDIRKQVRQKEVDSEEEDAIEESIELLAQDLDSILAELSAATGEVKE